MVDALILRVDQIGSDPFKSAYYVQVGWIQDFAKSENPSGVGWIHKSIYLIGRDEVLGQRVKRESGTELYARRKIHPKIAKHRMVMCFKSLAHFLIAFYDPQRRDRHIDEKLITCLAIPR